MILDLETGLYIKDPSKKIPDSVKDKINNNLKKGHCLFVVPEAFDKISVNSKKHKKTYKVGFLFDLLSEVYPHLDKTTKQEIIADKYHFWFSYRQFKTIIDEYNIDRKKYLYKPELL